MTSPDSEFRKKKMEAGQECYICMDEEDVLTMACGHVLHEECALGQLEVGALHRFHY